MRAVVITNNPSVSIEPQDRFVSGGLLDVLRVVRDMVHQGHQLVSHPLAGSVKPNETPFKSVVVSKVKKNPVDFQSVSIIEGALRTAERMLLEKPLLDYSERVITDFQTIDRMLLDTALSCLPGDL